MKKKEETSRARSVTHPASAELPTSRPPLVCNPHPTEKGRPTSLTRGDGIAAAVPGRRERREGGGGVGGGGRREHRMETDLASHVVTCDLSHHHLPSSSLSSRSVTMHGV